MVCVLLDIKNPMRVEINYEKELTFHFLFDIINAFVEYVFLF